MNRVSPIVGLASHLGRGVQRIATDAIVGRVRSLPRTIGDLDANALSQIMGRTVTSVAVIGGDAGTTSRARLALTGDGVPKSYGSAFDLAYTLVTSMTTADRQVSGRTDAKRRRAGRPRHGLAPREVTVTDDLRSSRPND